MALCAGQAYAGELPSLVEFARPRLDELVAAGDEVAHGLLGERRRGLRLDIVARGELGDNGSVDAVGLGQNTDGTGVVADVAWVEDGEGEVRLGECVGQGAFVAAGGLEGDQAGLSIAAVLDEGAQTGGGGLEAPEGSGGVSSEVEPVLRDVDADAEGRVHEVSSCGPAVPCLVMRAQQLAQATVRAAGRAGEWGRGGHALPRSCETQG